MDDLRSIAEQATEPMSIRVYAAAPMPDDLAKRVFTLAIIGVIVYVSAVLLLLSSAG